MEIQCLDRFSSPCSPTGRFPQFTTLSGKVYALNHLKFENDFAAGNFLNSLRETWLSTAYSMRPVRLQGEYANSTLDNAHLLAGAQKDSTIQAYYVQGSCS